MSGFDIICSQGNFFWNQNAQAGVWFPNKMQIDARAWQDLRGETPGKTGPMMDRDDKTALEDQISENLKRAFGQRGPEELPDRFRDLLDQLRTQDEESGGKKGSDHGER